jgi:hypothetical protein
MKPAIKKLVPALIVMSFTLGCSLFNQMRKQAEAGKKTEVITSTDNKTQLTIPGSWDKQTNLNDDATLQVANLIGGQYAIVISESKKDLGTELSLQDLTDAAKENTTKNVLLENVVMGEPKPVTINGYPAVQFESNGMAAGIKLNWIYTLIDAPKNYHQVITWSLASKYEQNKPVLLEVANSFKEIDASVDSPPPPRKKK